MKKIVLSGVETNNKGAELMFYAILQEIENRYPNSIVYVGYRSVSQGLSYLRTTLKLKYKPIEVLTRPFIKTKIIGLLSRLGILPLWLQDVYAVKKADYFIDGSGLAFCDSMQTSKIGQKRWETLLKRTKQQGTKIVFLPQAFGPANNEGTKNILKCISDSSDIIYSRDNISTKVLKDSNMVDMSKVLQYPDFTTLVNGEFPKKYENLKNKVCIIPNAQMVNQGVLTSEAYIQYLCDLITHIKDSGEDVYILNHEGTADYKIALLCQQKLNKDICLVNGLNALEVKGFIATAKLVITSRFHGAVSALNSCVPCLATSWSHKYSELFLQYNQDNCVLPVEDISGSLKLIDKYLDTNYNETIRLALKPIVENIKAQNKEMWKQIWELSEKKE